MNAIIWAAAAVAVAIDRRRCRHLFTVIIIIIIVSVVRFVGVFLVDHSVTIAAAIATAIIVVGTAITTNTAKCGIVKSIIITVVISLIVMNER